MLKGHDIREKCANWMQKELEMTTSLRNFFSFLNSKVKCLKQSKCVLWDL